MTLNDSSLNDAFVRYGVLHSTLNIDKAMLSYFGRHGCKTLSASLEYLYWKITRHR